MNKLITAFCLSIALSVSIFAQTNNSSNKDNYDQAVPPVPSPTSITVNYYNKNEFYGGYSNQQVEDLGRSTFHGFEGSYTRNVSRWIGVRGVVSGAYKNRTLTLSLNQPTGNVAFEQDYNRSIYNFLGGVQLKDNQSEKRFKPFAFALAGVAVNRVQFKNLRCTSQSCATAIPFIVNTSFTDTGLAGAFGGGLDVKINKRFDFRVIQFDYNPIYTNSRVENNFRIGAGIVFK